MELRILSALQDLITSKKVTAKTQFSTVVDDILSDKVLSNLQQQFQTENVAIETAQLSWSYTVLEKKYGIHSMFAFVPDQRITLSGQYETADGDYVDFEDYVNISNVSVQYKADDVDMEDLSLVPTAIVESQGNWTVTFRI